MREKEREIEKVNYFLIWTARVKKWYQNAAS